MASSLKGDSTQDMNEPAGVQQGDEDRTRREIVRKARQVVMHEVGHHFGMSDERLRELGAY